VDCRHNGTIVVYSGRSTVLAMGSGAGVLARRLLVRVVV